MTGLCLVACSIMALSAPSPLAEYVQEPEEAYGWSELERMQTEEGRVIFIRLTSQRWLTEEEVDRPLWEHWLTLYVPNTVRFTTGMLFIGGGSNKDELPAPSEELGRFAASTQSIVADLAQVPNQPLTFAQDPSGEPRYEDALIAFGWDRFRATDNPEWLARLPMTKSAAQAMTAIQEWARQEAAEGVQLVEPEQFVVAGASKRGWTTWTTAAMDDRVRAAAPLVIDVLNVRESMEHHYRAYGFWAPAIGDYVDMELTKWLNTPAFDALMDIVDPYNYLDQLRMPKYIVNSAGDQFFLPDSSQFYFDELQGETLLRYVPNTDHGLDDESVPQSLLAWYAMILQGLERPSMSWTIRHDEQGVRFEATSRPQPREAYLWTAVNVEARDFREAVIGRTWTKTPLEPNEDGAYIARVEEPEAGWRAGLVEFHFEGPQGLPLILTTEVAVAPDELPHELPPELQDGAAAAAPAETGAPN